MQRRPRRNRKSPAVRALLQETRLSTDDLIYPLFLIEGQGKAEPVASMPGVSRFSLDLLLEEVGQSMELGVKAFCLFPSLPESRKNEFASESWREGSLYLEAVKAVKRRYPGCALMTDVAMDPYSSDGHDGLVQNGQILNDETLPILAKMALAQAEAGADWIGPSDMMDGRVGYLRDALDAEGFQNVGIVSYTAKYASAFYGPFREALDSAPKHGDKKTYQMNPANAREALVEAELDDLEGADVLMVKPALPYLDVIHRLKEATDLPIAAYNVSGEYAMLQAAAQNGWLDGPAVMAEALMSIKRAGADLILTYFAKAFAQTLKDG